MNKLTAAEYEALKAKIARFEKWVDTKRGKNGWASYRHEEIPQELLPAPTNDERSSVEVYEFCSNPPRKYFVYINQEKKTATTWAGDVLGSVSFGREYRCPAFGRRSTRQPVSIKAINGKSYYGTYYKSSGNYARITACK